MMRRLVARSPAATSMAIAMRCAGGAPTHHDHTHSFSRPLTPTETTALEGQKHRTVSSVVPGKLFMRHWIAAEQSTVSIVNRTLSILVTVGIFVWASGYSTMGINGLNAWHVMLMSFLANWIILHTHMLWLGPVALGIVAAQILFN